MWIFKKGKSDINMWVWDFHIDVSSKMTRVGKPYFRRLVVLYRGLRPLAGPMIGGFLLDGGRPIKNPSCKSAERGMYYYEQI